MIGQERGKGEAARAEPAKKPDVLMYGRHLAWGNSVAQGAECGQAGGKIWSRTSKRELVGGGGAEARARGEVGI